MIGPRYDDVTVLDLQAINSSPTTRLLDIRANSIRSDLFLQSSATASACIRSQTAADPLGLDDRGEPYLLGSAPRKGTTP